MMYRVVSYDRITERMKGGLIVPPSVLGQVKAIADSSRRTTDWANIRWTRNRSRQSRDQSGLPANRANSITSVEPFDPARRTTASGTDERRERRLNYRGR